MLAEATREVNLNRTEGNKKRLPANRQAFKSKRKGIGTEKRGERPSGSAGGSALRPIFRSFILGLGWNVLFGCLCWDVCLSATGEARRTCIKTSTRPIVTPKTK